MDPANGTFKMVAQTEVSAPAFTIGAGVILNRSVSEALLQLPVTENTIMSTFAESGT